MNPVKRIEIIIDSLQLKELLTQLEAIGVSGYTVIRDVTGTGDRGERSGDQLTDALKNGYVLIACPESQLQQITDALGPMLKEYGGICLVSDAEWLEH